MKSDKRNISLNVVVTCGVLASVSAAAGVITYKVKKGESLSEILYSHNLKPLYGKNGFVKKTTLLNKNKINKNGNFVKAGALIVLPEGFETKTEIANDNSTPIKKDLVAEVNDIISVPKESRSPSDEYPTSRFTYSPKLASLRVDSTNAVRFGGSDVTALSKLGAGITVNWQVLYSDLYSFYGYGSLDYFSFYDDSTYSLSKTNITRMHLGLGAGYTLSPETKLTSEISLRQVTFLDVVSATRVNVESMPVPEIKIGIEQVLFTKKKLSVLVKVHAAVLLPGKRESFKSDTGVGAGLGLEAIHGNKSLSVNYDFRSMKIDNIENKENSISLAINFYGDYFL